MNDARRKLVSTCHATVIQHEETTRAVLFWLLGIPIPIIILLYVLHVV